MENQEMRNPQTEPWNDLSRRVQQLSVETARAQESAERSLSEAARARIDTETCETKLQSHRRSLTGLWSVVVILVLALGGATWDGYSTAQRQAQGYDNLSAKLPALEQSLQAAGERIQATENKLQSWAGDWKGWGDRLTKLEKRVTANIQLARDYAQQQANEVHRQVLAELDNRTAWIQARLGRIESTQESQRAHIAEVQEDVAQVRREMFQQLAQAQRETGRDMEDLHKRVSDTRNDLDATRSDLDQVAWQLNRNRMDFELVRNQNRELVRNISITLKNTNVPYQRVEEGWVQLVSDGRFLWIRSQGIQQPLTFYTQQDSRPYQIVFTRVTKDGAVGYLVYPGGPPVASSASSGPLAGETEFSVSALGAR